MIALCPPTPAGDIPLSKTRKKIERKFRKYHHEHLLIYINREHTKQIWQYVIDAPDKPRKTREIQYDINKDPEILYQRARGLLFTLDEEENITLVDVTSKFKKHFAKNTEKLTKKFYREFKKHHKNFLDFISGIDDAINDEDNRNKQWYASLMLNRLMFCYFIQKRGYLDNNTNYLQDKLKEVKAKSGEDKFYSFYRSFLLELFHEGLGKPEENRTQDVDLGKIPYLDGGLFGVHELERKYDAIQIKDDAFEKIFNFFDQWNWHLDTRIEASGKDINPDVLGYIFEKYVNDRAAMGAYYTREDITEYISKNTIIPFLYDKVKREYPKPFKENGYVWSFLKESGASYIYDAVKKGVPEKDGLFDDLPEEIKKGFMPDYENEVVKDSNSPHLWEIRKCWNKKAPEEIALPTEIYREVIERRKRYSNLKAKIGNGEISEINDFITYNLNIRQFTQDLLENIDDSDFIRHFFKAIKSITILDPTCGSGAFLFAALNILEPLYETCIERMEQYTSEKPRKYKFFHEVLAEVNSEEHPNLDYFIYKTIILNNLYGVDIMHEAVEIAKLRLFLKMVAAVDLNLHKPNYGLEPLPDIDFNIRTGNTLVGFATEDDFKKAVYEKEPIFADQIISEFEDEFKITSRAFTNFQDSQLIIDKGKATHRKAKKELQRRLELLADKLNGYLASNYGIDKKKEPKKYKEWLNSHQPFHWLAEFYEIIKGNGGFDIVIGNPPYVKYSRIRDIYQVMGLNTIECGNLYPFILEKSKYICRDLSFYGFIIPLSAFCTKRMEPLVNSVNNSNRFSWVSHFCWRPATLFEGVNIPLCILISSSETNKHDKYTTEYYKWYKEKRDSLMFLIGYSNISNYSLHSFVIPKFPKRFTSVLDKLINQKSALFKYLANSEHKLYYRNTGGLYWRIITHFKPKFIVNGEEGSSSTLSNISFQNNNFLLLALASLNSNLFWFYYVTYSSFHHLNRIDIESFPISLDGLDSNTANKLKHAAKMLMEEMKANSILHTRKHKGGKISQSQTFFPSLTKNLVDSIDEILANYYNFSEEELDNIINYDIIYRMGDELNSYINDSLCR